MRTRTAEFTFANSSRRPQPNLKSWTNRRSQPAPLFRPALPEHLNFTAGPARPTLNNLPVRIGGTEWNKKLSRTNIPARAFSLDANDTTFSDTEQTAIKNIWQRVAEDYAPFDIDVTTERPATFTTRTAHALITRSSDANGEPNPSHTAGGVAYVGIFGASSYHRYRPAWIYSDRLGNGEANIAEATSHELAITWD